MTAPAVWHSYDPETLARGMWDQTLVDDLLSGRVAHTSHTFAHYHGLDELPEGADGAVVVLPGGFNFAHVADLNRDLARLAWVLLIVTSDEQQLFPWSQVEHPNLRLWVMTPKPDTDPAGASVFLGEGYTPDTRPMLAGLGDKTLDWFFAGQITHQRRQECARALRRLPRGRLVETEGFTAGLDHETYYAAMASAKVVPCPSGPCTADSFRLYEAMEAGCVPLVDARTPAGDAGGLWSLIFGDPPFPLIEDWADAGKLTDAALADWPASAKRISAWWQGYKRDLAARLDDDLDHLGAARPTATLADLVTVLIPTSPIPSHPSTHIIEETIASVRERLPGVEIVLMLDGVRAEQEGRRADYEEYQRRLLWMANHRWPEVWPLRFEGHAHQVAMTKAALDRVRTPLILFVEHDTPLIGAPIPWASLCSAITSGEANLIRLHHEASVLAPHEHLMLDRTPVEVAGVPMLRTVQWSQRPSLASADFYRKFLDQHFGPLAVSMIEDLMHSVVQCDWHDHGIAGWEQWRLWMYAPPGDMKRSTHLDGRAGAEKYEMVFDRRSS